MSCNHWKWRKARWRWGWVRHPSLPFKTLAGKEDSEQLEHEGSDQTIHRRSWSAHTPTPAHLPKDESLGRFYTRLINRARKAIDGWWPIRNRLVLSIYQVLVVSSSSPLACKEDTVGKKKLWSAAGPPGLPSDPLLPKARIQPLVI